MAISAKSIFLCHEHLVELSLQVAVLASNVLLGVAVAEDLALVPHFGELPLPEDGIFTEIVPVFANLRNSQ